MPRTLKELKDVALRVMFASWSFAVLMNAVEAWEREPSGQWWAVGRLVLSVAFTVSLIAWLVLWWISRRDTD